MFHCNTAESGHARMNLCVIPARGGSKRIPRKNIKPFCGKPMIAWSIEAAKASECFNRIIVSTDDEEIAEVAQQWGAEVPFMRPTELADDYAGTTEVVRHAVEALAITGEEFSVVCCLYATAPLVKPADIYEGLTRLQNGSWVYCFTATTFSAPIFRSLQQTQAGGLEMFFPEHFAKRSQDLPEALHDAAQFYWGTPDAWVQQLMIFDHHSTALILPRWRVQDIDTEEDWMHAELIAKTLYSRASE